MTDILTAPERSHRMSLIRSKNTEPEIILRKALWRLGCRYRLNSKMPGKPDLVFPRAKLAVFVDGCFWHGCPIHYKKPKSNSSYWHPKIAANQERDQRNRKAIKKMKWAVISFWEHDVLRDAEGAAQKVQRVINKRIKN